MLSFLVTIYNTEHCTSKPVPPGGLPCPEKTRSAGFPALPAYILL